MTEKDKKIILDMRAAGIPYKAISEKLRIEVSALKVFVHQNKKPSARKCCLCGKRAPQALIKKRQNGYRFFIVIIPTGLYPSKS